MGKKSLQVLGIVLGLSLGGCALQHDLNVSGELELVHSVDTETLYAFFLDVCGGDVECANQEAREFLDWLYTTGGED